mmetsp:Transcript_38093/g.62279  ORF Transcript_38093/g.62279 Transcript_38093/m.62279 type:complete len:104 (+) Transcript_38093:547-858(+)
MWRSSIHQGGSVVVVLSVLYFGEGVRKGDLALNKTAMRTARRRRKKHMMFSKDKCVFVKPGEKKEYRDVSVDKEEEEEELGSVSGDKEQDEEDFSEGDETDSE